MAFDMGASHFDCTNQYRNWCVQTNTLFTDLKYHYRSNIIALCKLFKNLLHGYCSNREGRKQGMV